MRLFFRLKHFPEGGRGISKGVMQRCFSPRVYPQIKPSSAPYGYIV